MRILIVSDTHRREGYVQDVLNKVGKVDMLIHCGDVEGNEEILYEFARCPVHVVSGNNDFFSALPREKEFHIGDYKVLLTHGHNYYVSMGNEILKDEAISRGADIVMYGHTHKPVIDIGDRITAINPGSLAYPRQEGHERTFILMEIDRHGKAHYTLNHL